MKKLAGYSVGQREKHQTLVKLYTESISKHRKIPSSRSPDIGRYGIYLQQYRAKYRTTFPPHTSSAERALIPSETYRGYPQIIHSMDYQQIPTHPPRAERARRVLNGSKLRWAPL